MSVKPKGTGAKIGFKRGGIEAEANWSLADLVALTALGLGAGGAGRFHGIRSAGRSLGGVEGNEHRT